MDKGAKPGKPVVKTIDPVLLIEERKITRTLEAVNLIMQKKIWLYQREDM